MDIRQIEPSIRDLIDKFEADTPLVRWCVALIALLVVYIWVIQPVSDWYDSLEQQTAMNAEKAARLQGLREQSAAWKEVELLAERALQERSSVLLNEDSDTAAHAALQSLIQTKIQGRNIIVDSQTLLPSDTQSALGRNVRIAMTVRGSLYDILGLLDDVSSHEQLLLTRNWLIRVSGENRKQATAQFVIESVRKVDGT